MNINEVVKSITFQDRGENMLSCEKFFQLLNKIGVKKSPQVCENLRVFLRDEDKDEGMKRVRMQTLEALLKVNNLSWYMESFGERKRKPP